MVAHSKYQVMCAIENVECQRMVHPWTHSCTLSCLDVLSGSLRGTYKFFFIMYLVQVVLKGKKITRAYLKHQMQSFFRSLLYGAVCSSVTIATSCLMRNLLGKYYYITVIGVPAFMGGLAIFCEVAERRLLYSFTFVQMCVEYLIRVLEKYEIVRLSIGRETLAFMCCNGIFLYLLKTDTTKQLSYWFFRPTSDSTEQNNKEVTSKCQHSGPCWRHVLMSSSKYMGIGLGIQILRILLTKSRLMIREPKQTLGRFLLDKQTFELGSFLGAYIGIYGSVTCLLSNYYGRRSDLHAFPAGFLAGCAYWLHPNRTIGAGVITNTLKLLLQRGQVLGVIPVLPYASEVTFALSCAVLFHVRFFDYEYCPRFITNAITTVTNGRSDYVYGVFLKIINEFYQ